MTCELAVWVLWFVVGGVLGGLICGLIAAGQWVARNYEPYRDDA